MSFPEQSDVNSSEPEHRTGNRRSSSQPQPPTTPPKPPPSVTLAIFDSSLPVKARVSALFSSLAINLLLPFVNGVMLGFGEIFAKNVVLKWFGWGQPGGVAANAGVRKARGRKLWSD